MSGSQQNEDILNAALDELDDGSDYESSDEEVEGGEQNDVKDNEKKSSIHKPVFGPVPPPPPQQQQQQYMNDEEEMLKVMGELESFLMDDIGATKSNKGNKKVQPTDPSSSDGKGSDGGTSTNGMDAKSSFSTELDSAISNLLGEISKPPELPKNLEGVEEDIANGFFKEFEKSMRMPPSGTASGGTEGTSEGDEEIMGDVVNGMMKQLLSKELMYEPMKGICDRFPKWLAENKSKLDDEEYQRYVISSTIRGKFDSGNLI